MAVEKCSRIVNSGPEKTLSFSMEQRRLRTNGTIPLFSRDILKTD